MKGVKKPESGNYLERERKDSEELLEILKKVPENRKSEVLGIIKGYALCAENAG